MPIIGLGVWRMEGQAIKDLIINSIKIGYRHFDCAGIFFFYSFKFRFQSSFLARCFEF